MGKLLIVAGVGGVIVARHAGDRPGAVVQVRPVDVDKEGVAPYLGRSLGQIAQSARWVDGAETVDQVLRRAGDVRGKLNGAAENSFVWGWCVLDLEGQAYDGLKRVGQQG